MTRFEQLDVDSFNHLENLEELVLAGNYLTKIDLYLVKMLKKLKTFDIGMYELIELY